MTTKIKPVDHSSRPGPDDHKENKHQKKKKKFKFSPGPAAINHIISRTKRKSIQMKQLKLPFGEATKLDLKVFELYRYRDPRARYKAYGNHVEYTLAKNMNQAEELFSNTYPGWWKTMGVKESSVQDVVSKLESLKEQVTTCKFVLQALNIN